MYHIFVLITCILLIINGTITNYKLRSKYSERKTNVVDFDVKISEIYEMNIEKDVTRKLLWINVLLASLIANNIYFQGIIVVANISLVIGAIGAVTYLSLNLINWKYKN